MSGPLPTVSIGLPATIYVNETFNLAVTFRNSSTTPADIGFVPYFDLIVPNNLIIQSVVPLAVWNNLSIPPRWEGPVAFTTPSGLTTYIPNGTPITVYPGGYPNSILPTGPFNPNTKLYSINVGYSSYGPDQPDLEFDYGAIYDYGTQLIPSTIAPSNIQSRGIFMLGTDAQVNLNDFITEPIQTTLLNAVQYETRKTHSLIVGDKQPTGPNYPIQYRLSTHIAPGQTFDDLIIRDQLNPALRHVTSFAPVFTGIPLTLVAGNPVIGEFKVPGNDTILNHFYEFHYGPIIGAPTTGTNLIIDYQVYVDYYLLETNTAPANQAGSPYVLNAEDPQNSITIINTVDVFDGPDQMVATPAQTDQFIAGPYALSKRFTGPVNTVGQPIPYTMTIYISDYFSMGNIVITDNISGGQIFQGPSTSTPPTYTISGGSSNIRFLSSAITEANLFTTPITTPNPPLDIFNQVTFVVPNSQPGSNTPYLGSYSGPIFETNATSPNYSTNPIDPSVTNVIGGRKTITINYSTILQNNYAPFYPGFDTNPTYNIELLGEINNSALVNANSINIFETTSDPNKVGSGSVTIRFPSVSVTKSIYAYNGTIGAFPVSGFISPNDILAYRTRMTFPFQNISNVVWRDYLPLPLISVSNYSGLVGSTISQATPANLSSPWLVFWGPDHTPTLNNGTTLDSIFNLNNSSNEITLDYGTFVDDPPRISIVLDIIYTVQIGNQPFKDGLFFTNQSVLDIGNNINRVDAELAVSNFTIAQPFIPSVKKSLTTGNTSQQNTFGLFGTTSTPSLPTIFDPTYYDNFTPVVNTSLVANQNLRYVVMLKNTGHHPAHRIQIQDILSSFLTYSVARLYRYHNNSGTGVTTLVNPTDYTLTVTTPNIVFELNPQTASIEPNRVIGLDELYVLILDAVTTSNLPDCGEIVNTARINQYFNSPTDPNNYVGPISTLASVTATNTSQVRSPTLGMSVAYTSTIGNTEAIGFVPGETITGTLTVTYPPGTTDNVLITATPTGSMSSVTIVPTAPTNITFGSNSVGGNTWSHTTVTNSSSANINVNYTFTVTIPNTQAGGTYRTNILFTSGETLPRTCNLTTGRNFRVDRPAITITQHCHSVNLVAGQVAFSYTVTNATDNTIYDVAINNSVPSGLQIISTSVSPNAGTTAITNPVWTITSIPATTSYIVTVTMTATIPPIPIGTVFTNTITGTYAFVSGGPTSSISANVSSLTYNLPIKLQSNLSNITYTLHNSDIATNPARGVVGAIGDVIEYRISVGALPNILYNRLEINFGSIPHPISDILILPTAAVILNTDEINGLGTLPITTSTVSSNRIVTLTFPSNQQFGYLVEPQPTNSFQEYTIVLPVKIANHLYNQAGILFDPNISLIVYQNNTTVPVTINPNSGILNTCANPLPFVSIDNFRIVEPNITLTKTFVSYTSPSTLRYNIAATNTAYNATTNPWVSSAFQLELIDDKFDVPGLFTSIQWQTIPNNWSGTINGLLARAISNATTKMVPGSSVTFTIDANYDPGSLLQAQNFINTAELNFKSKFNDDGDARTGADGPSTDTAILLNNYARIAQSTVLLDKPNISKHLITENITTAGKTIRFAYVVTLPEGTNNNVVIDDTFSNNPFSSGYLSYVNATIVTTQSGSIGLLTDNFNGNIGLNVTAFVPTNNNFRIGFPSITVVSDNILTNNSFVIFLDLLVNNTTINISDNYIVDNIVDLSYSLVTVDPNGPTIVPGPTLSTDTKSVTIVHPELFIRKEVLTDPSEWFAGNQIEYLLTIGHTSNSSMDAYNLNISDNLATQLILVAPITITSTCGLDTTVSGFPITSVTSLSIGCILTIKYKATIPLNAPENTIYINTATLTYNNNDGTNTNPVVATITDSNTIRIGADAIILRKECNAKLSKIEPGGYVTYDIIYKNTGPTQLTNIVLTEGAIATTNQLWLSYLPTNNPGWLPSTVSVGPFTYQDLIPMLPNTERTVRFRLEINIDSPPGSYTFTNEVALTSTQITTPITTQSEGINMLVNPPVISVSKTLTSDSILEPGGLVKWIISYTNTGDYPANNVTLTENIQTAPTQWLSFVGPNTWVNTLSTLNYVYTDPVPLLPSQTKTVLFQTQISTPLPRGNYSDTNTINMAANYLNNQNQSVNLSATNTADIAFGVDMPIPFVEKEVTNSNLTPGGFIEWTIRYRNLGESAMTNISLIESPLPTWATLPSGSWSGSPPTYQPALPTLNPGQSNTVTYRINIQNNIVPGTYQYDNIITLESTDTNSVALPNVTGINSVQFTYTSPLITIEKIYEPGQSILAPGGQIYWTIRLRNSGNGSSTGQLIENISAYNWLNYQGIGWTLSSGQYTYDLTISANTTIDVPFIVNIAGILATDNYLINNLVSYAQTSPSVVNISDTSIVEFETDPPIPFVEKTYVAGINNLVAGGQISWDITYTNRGQTNMHTIELIEDITTTPTQWLAFDSVNSTSGWVASSGDVYTLTDTNPLGPGQSRTVRFTVDISNTLLPATYNFINVVEMRSESRNQSGLPTSLPIVSSSSPITFVVGQGIPSVEKLFDAGNSDLKQGGFVSWIIRCRNIGQTALQSVVLTEPGLPTWLTFSGPSGWSGSGPYTYNVGTINPNQSIDIIFDANISGTLPPGSYAYDNVVALDSKDINNNQLPQITASDDIRFIIGDAFVNVSKTTSTVAATLGSTINWFITINNIGPAAMSNVIITEPVLPNWLAFSTSNSGWTPTSGLGPFTYNTIASIAIGETITVPFNVDVIAPPPSSPFSYVNQAVINYDTDKNLFVDANIVVTIFRAVPSIYKITDNTNPQIGDIVTWFINYCNVGNFPSSNIILTESVPNWMEFVGPVGYTAYNVNGWNQSGSNYVYTDNVALGPNQCRSVYFKTKVISTPDPLVNPYTNTVNIDMFDTANLNLPASSSANSNIAIIHPDPELVITKETCCNKTVYQPGEQIVWTITVKNIGGQIARNVVLTESLLPSYLNFVGPSGPAGWSGNPLQYTIGDIGPNQTVSVQFVTVVSTSNMVPETFINEVTASANNVDDVSATHTIEINYLSGLSIEKKLISRPLACSKITYEIILKNTGNTTYTGPLRIFDTYPKEFIIKETPDYNWQVDYANNYASILVIDENESIAVGESIRYEITFSTKKTCPGTYTNTASAYQTSQIIKPTTDPYISIVSTDYLEHANCYRPIVINKI